MAISCCPRSADKTLRFEIVDDLPETELQAMVKVTEAPDGIEVDTGPLSFFIPNAGFLPICDVRLGGVRLWGKAPFKGFTVRCDGQDVGSASGPVELEIEEAGPLRAVLLMTGKHRLPDGSGYLDLHGRITAYAGKPYIEVEHQFIHAEEKPELALEAVELAFAPQADGFPHLALGQGYYRTQIQESDGEALVMALDAETLLYQSNEHFR